MYGSPPPPGPRGGVRRTNESLPKESTAVDGPQPTRPRRWPLARVGWLALPLFGAWFLLALLIPSPTGAFLSAIPILAFLLAVSAFLWAFGLLRARRRWNRRFRTTAVIGLVAGLVLSGAMTAAAAAEGCPWLAPFPSGEPSGWQKAGGQSWSSGGVPEFFFYASVACPFCSATSWPVWKALSAFGNMSNVTFGYSTPTDIHPNTPEVILAGARYVSTYVELNVHEDTDPTTIRAPSLDSCTELAYVNSYDGGQVPFLVVGGIFLHAGTLVDPSVLSGLTTAQVSSQVTNGSGPAWSALAPATYMLEAILEKTGGNAPAAVASDPNVQADLALLR
jgi:uncharacterized protein DUF929